jgi:hypothetical protein
MQVVNIALKVMLECDRPTMGGLWSNGLKT